MDYYLSLPSWWYWSRTRKHFFHKWHNGTCGQQMAIKNTAGNRGFLFPWISLHLLLWCTATSNAGDTSAVLLNGTFHRGRFFWHFKGQCSSKFHEATLYYAQFARLSTQKRASWQFQLAIYLRGLHHPMGHGHGHNLSTGGKEFLFQIGFFSWCSASVLRDRGSSLDVFFHYSLEFFCW